MNPSTMSRGRRAPTFRSLHCPRRTPAAIKSVGSTAVNSAATSPQPSPARPSACQPTASTVTISQFFGSSQYVTRRAQA